MAKQLRKYAVTMTSGGESEMRVISAFTGADAIKSARRWYNDNEGRTRQCELLPRRFRACLTNEDESN